MNFIVIEVGCLECDIPTYYRGQFETYDAAYAYIRSRPEHGSDISYYIFDLTKPETDE